MSHRPRSFSICASFALCLLIGHELLAQKQGKTKPAAAVAKKDSKGVPQQPTKESAAITAAASDALNQRPAPGADYIPCRFTDAELKALSAPEQVLTLSPADAEDLVSKVTAAIQQQQQAGLISADAERELFAELTKTSLTGLTPSEALQRVIQATVDARTNVIIQQNATATADISSPIIETNASNQTKPPSKVPDSGTNQKTIDLSSILLSGNLALVDKTVAQASTLKTDQVLQTKTAEGKVRNTLVPNTEVSQDLAPVVNSARDAIERLTRPTDVGCAMSVLSYNETSKAFGYIIANNYIAVQVVVRNLNRVQQFVLHDVEYSVNADPVGSIGRYYSGRDKVVVRSLASAESSFDPRNLIVHSAQGIGAIMTTLVPIFGGPIGDAAAAFNGGFFPSLDKAWKDMSTDQLNLLNDTGFTSQSTSQTIVAKADKAMFVTFIPSKQYERGWWTQDCVKATPLGILNAHGIRALEPLGASSKVTYALPTTAIDEAIQACAIQAYSRLNAVQKSRIASAFDSAFHKGPQSFSAPEVSPADLDLERSVLQKCSDLERKSRATITPSEQSDLLRCTAPAMLYANVPKRIYRNWSGNSVALFQELSTVVIAGMHIVDDATLQPSITSVDCTKNDLGFIVFPFPDTGTIVCPVKGKNVGKVKWLRLRNNDESAYTEGLLNQASGDDASGTVSFPSAQLHDFKKPDYAVFALSSTKVETGTNQVLHFDLMPYLSKTDPVALDATSLPVPPDMTLTGFHLDKVAAVHFYLTDPTKFAAFVPITDPASNDHKIKIKLDTTELAKIGASGDVKVSIIPSGGGKEISLNNTLKFMPPAVAPKAVDAPPNKVKKQSHPVK